MNDRNARSTVASNYHFDNGRDHWRNPLWLIPLIHETPIRGLQTRPANRECRHPTKPRRKRLSAGRCASGCDHHSRLFLLPEWQRNRQRRPTLAATGNAERARNTGSSPASTKLNIEKAARAGLFTITEMAANHIWIGLAKVARADSRTASDMVGWAWQVRAKSSDEPPNSISTASSWIISPAL